MPIRKAVYTLTVLYDEDDADSLEWSPEGVAWAISAGPCIGSMDAVSDTEVPSEAVRSELLAVGNDGTFFYTGEDD